MLKRFLRNKELRVKIVPSAKDGFAPEEIEEEQLPIDLEQAGDIVKEVVTHTVETVVKAVIAYKLLDTLCKIVVKKI